MSEGLKHPERRRGVQDRRRSGRRRQEHLICTLGPVLDLSRGGLRVLATRPWKGLVTLEVISNFGSLELKAAVAWSRRLGFRRHEVGLRLLEVDETLARKLTDIASAHAMDFSSIRSEAA